MIFVSYSWFNEKPDQNVRDLVASLRLDGYDATCDELLMQQESSIHFEEMMAKNLYNAAKVIIVLSESYKKKADSFTGGVGEEYRYIITDIKNNRRKYILVSFTDELSRVVPDFLQGREVLYLSEHNNKYNQLLHKLSETPTTEYPDVNPERTIPTQTVINGLKWMLNGRKRDTQICDESEAEIVAIGRLTYQPRILEVALSSNNGKAHTAAIEKLTYQPHILAVAMHSIDSAAKIAAIKKLTYQPHIRDIALSSNDGKVHSAAIEKLTYQQYISDVIKHKGSN